MRIYVGGVPPDVTPAELVQRFAAFGDVQGCELLPPKAGALPPVPFHVMLQASQSQTIVKSSSSVLCGRHPKSGPVAAAEQAAAAVAMPAHRGVAYLDLHPKDGANLQKCLRVYNNSKWRGSTMHVEVAQPSYLERLQAEWCQDEEAEFPTPQQNEGW